MTVSSHYKYERYYREMFIYNFLGGDGHEVDSFIIDKGHRNGAERHVICSHGVIVIYNANSGVLVTKMIARPGQIRRYYERTKKNPPQWLINIAIKHTRLGYNEMFN